MTRIFLKRSILYVSKCFGFFLISKILTKRRLRILCYHGFSYTDQSSFRPKLYIDITTFEKRINYLKGNNYYFLKICELRDYFKDLISQDFPIFLTIDDGWQSTHEIALPVLKKQNIPYTIYLYTDCYEKKIPVLNVLLQYVLWKTDLDQVTWGAESFNLMSESDKTTLLGVFLSETDTLDKNHLHEKLTGIFKTLEVDYSLDQEWKDFSLLNKAEIKEHMQHGGSFQLHTHHHINPLQDDLLMEELKVNRRIIESATGQAAEHFSYPGGVYSQDNYPLLKNLGIISAVTCVPGLNDKNTHPYELKRFLDGENISQIEFEAEMCGFMDFVRKIFRRS